MRNLKEALTEANSIVHRAGQNVANHMTRDHQNSDVLALSHIVADMAKVVAFLCAEVECTSSS